ncbi:hypothetical protein EI94DRAFT_1798503 [Lactarius quietus]|nr:hypothetical protein EI94DRAFT_1798503 [Lactarius quietus]
MDADGFQRAQSATSSRSLKTKSRQNAVFTPLICDTIVNPQGNPVGNPYPWYPHATPSTPALPGVQNTFGDLGNSPNPEPEPMVWFGYRPEPEP